MEVGNINNSGYSTGNIKAKDSPISKKFSDIFTDSMNRFGDTNTANRTKDTIELSAESKALVSSAEATKADETTITQEQSDMLSEKYDPSDFYYVSDYGDTCLYVLGGSHSKGRAIEFYEDLKEMDLLSEGEYDLLRLVELFDIRIGLRRLDTGEWLTPEYQGREYRKEFIDKYGEEEAEKRITEIINRVTQGELSDVLTKLAGIFQEVFHAESADETDMIVQECMKLAEFYK